MLQQLSSKKKKNASVKKDVFYDGILSPDDESVSLLFLNLVTSGNR